MRGRPSTAGLRTMCFYVHHPLLSISLHAVLVPDIRSFCKQVVLKLCGVCRKNSSHKTRRHEAEIERHRGVHINHIVREPVRSGPPAHTSSSVRGVRRGAVSPPWPRSAARRRLRHPAKGEPARRTGGQQHPAGPYPHHPGMAAAPPASPASLSFTPRRR